MLEKPDLQDDLLVTCLREGYGVPCSVVEFLPLGADIDTAVYRAIMEDDSLAFVKLRRGNWLEASVLVPALLHEQGVENVIPPQPTVDGNLWAQLNEYSVIVSPFVAGSDGFARPLTDDQWVALGAITKRLHTLALPDNVRCQLPHETWSGGWRDRVRSFQTLVEYPTFDDPWAQQLASMLREQRAVVTLLLSRAEQLASVLRERPAQPVVCHADLHAWNLLIDDSDTLHIVDWDTLRIAPKECDLMMIGSGIGNWDDPHHGELFYQGYGDANIDHEAIAYYRCERIIQDIAAYCGQLLESNEGGDDRPQALCYFASQFEQGGIIEIALATGPS